MYAYEWHNDSYKLVDKTTGLEKELRPVFFEELKFLALDKNFGWQFPNSKKPLCWAQGRRYFYRGELVAETCYGDLFDLPELKNVVPNLSLKPVNLSSLITKNENFLRGLIQRTLKEIYGTFEKYKRSVDIFYAAFSGGKDSLVMLDLVQRALPHDSFAVIFGDTTMELSDTYSTVDAAKNFFADLQWLTARAPFVALDSWKFMGPPARNIRWCCPVHKAGPSLLAVKKILADRRGCSVAELHDFRTMAFVGVRAAESERRSTYEEIAVSKKHRSQLNFYPILRWSSAEIFLYLFAEKLPFNQAYRNGLPRVGCKLCPMASPLNDCLQNFFYRKELAPFVDVLKETIDKNFSSNEQWRDYLRDGGWKKRSGGKILSFAEKKLEVSRDGERYTFKLTNPNYPWRKWLTVLGDTIELDADRISLHFGGENFIITATAHQDAEIISVHLAKRDRTRIKFLSLLKNVLLKAAYCRNCRNCVIECPHGALTISADDVSIKNCRHCLRCLDKPCGCLAADSLRIGGEINAMTVSKIDRYKTFGLRAEWIKILFAEPQTFWGNERMGPKMFESFGNWGRDVGLLDDKKNFAANFDKLQSLGAFNIKLWGMFWTNAAYRSSLINFFVRKIDFGLPIDNETFVDLLGDENKLRTKKNALLSLKNAFLTSPLGTELGQGLCELKSKQVISVTRTAWQNPEPLVILHSLYMFAEHCDGLYSFTLTELLADCDERNALSPKILFGLDADILRPILQGLAGDYRDFIRVDFNKDIMENIFLNAEKSAADVVQLF